MFLSSEFFLDTEVFRDCAFHLLGSICKSLAQERLEESASASPRAKYFLVTLVVASPAL